MKVIYPVYRGPTGATGATGATGPQGPTGATGPAGTGTIRQVVYDESTTATTPSPLTTYTALSGLSASITPANSSNTVLVQLAVPVTITRATAGNGCGIRIKRDSTVIWESTDDASGPYQPFVSATGSTGMVLNTVIAVSLRDSPATTSPVTYTVEGRVRSSTSTGTCTFIPLGSTVTAPGTLVLSEVVA